MGRHLESHLELHPPHDASRLLHASEWLGNEGKRFSVPADLQDRLDLFLNEALANVIDHGGPSALASPIRLNIRLAQFSSNNEVSLTIVDAGKEFDPLSHQPRPLPTSLDDVTPGGLGIPMIRNLADKVSYDYHNNQNHLAFTVHWNEPAERPVDVYNAPGIRIQPFKSEERIHAGTQAEDLGRLGIHSLHLFDGADESAVLGILNVCDVLILSPGTPLLKPGTANDSVFILLSGDLAAYLDSDLNPDAAIAISPGECIGEMSALDGKPVTALVVAITEAHVLRVASEQFLNGLLTVPGVARNMLVALTERMRRTNETMMAAQREQLALQHLQKELDVARQLQDSMLPLRNPMFPEREDLEVAALMKPASEVGGDLFDAFFVDDRHLFLCIGDVSGHGIPAALFMARSIGLMRIAAMGTMRPDEIITKINDQLCAGNDTNLFVTLFCGFLNVETGRLVYSNGGHCAPILVSGPQAASIPIPRGTLVGAIPGLSYTPQELVLGPEDTLVCYTDGITEAQTESGEEFSEERLTALLAGIHDQPTDEMMERIRSAVEDFTGNIDQDDDYTVLAVRRYQGKQPA